jgi:hypothetical protein
MHHDGVTGDVALEYYAGLFSGMLDFSRTTYLDHERSRERCGVAVLVDEYPLFRAVDRLPEARQRIQHPFLNKRDRAAHLLTVPEKPGAALRLGSPKMRRSTRGAV